VFRLGCLQGANQIRSRIAFGSTGGDGIAKDHARNAPRTVRSLHCATPLHLAQGCQQDRSRDLRDRPVPDVGIQVFLDDSVVADRR